MHSVTRAVLAASLLCATSLSAGAVERGGTMTYGRYADSLFLDPVLTDANVDIWIMSNLHDTLILPSADGKGLEPGLASAWTVSPDGTTITFTLRNGIEFSDGPRITPEDVKFSLERAANPNSAILPQTAFEAAEGTTDEEKAKAYSQHPISSGPFVLQSWDRGSSMKLVRNPHYWAKGEWD